MPYQATRDGFLISTDRSLIDLDLVHTTLARMYWSEGIPREVVRRGIEGAMTFGVYDRSRAGPGVENSARGVRGARGPEARATSGTQIGFGRVITDTATFAYLSDVFILEEYRGRGLSKWLVEIILAHPDLQGLRRFCLLTRDAHSLYERFGFKPMADPTRFMERWDPEVYRRGAR